MDVEDIVKKKIEEQFEKTVERENQINRLMTDADRLTKIELSEKEINEAVEFSLKLMRGSGSPFEALKEMMDRLNIVFVEVTERYGYRAGMQAVFNFNSIVLIKMFSTYGLAVDEEKMDEVYKLICEAVDMGIKEAKKKAEALK